MSNSRKSYERPKKSIRRLTDKQKAYIKLRVENPKMTKTAAVMRTYNTVKPTNAGAMANKLEKNTLVQSALAAHADVAERTIVKAILDYEDSDKQWQRTLAVESSKWVHDKLYGKAVQRNDNVNLNFTQHAANKAQEYNL
jgi:ribosomal protein S17